MSEPTGQPAERATPRLYPSSRPCDRQDFAGHPAGGTCPDCGHAVVVHVGAQSCAMCRLEWMLSPAYWQRQARIYGRGRR